MLVVVDHLTDGGKSVLLREIKLGLGIGRIACGIAIHLSAWSCRCAVGDSTPIARNGSSSTTTIAAVRVTVGEVRAPLCPMNMIVVHPQFTGTKGNADNQPTLEF